MVVMVGIHVHLPDHREDLVQTRTRVQNRLRRHLHALDPQLVPPDRALDRAVHLGRLVAQPTDLVVQGVDGTVRRLALELISDVRDLAFRIDDVEAGLETLVPQQAPRLLELPGRGVPSAAEVVGGTANPSRFRSEAHSAMHAGVAPIPASSVRTDRHGLARGGNRQLNAALHRLTLTQARRSRLGRSHDERPRARGHSSMDALRALGRRLARVVFDHLPPTDHAAAASVPQAA